MGKQIFLHVLFLLLFWLKFEIIILKGFGFTNEDFLKHFVTLIITFFLFGCAKDQFRFGHIDFSVFLPRTTGKHLPKKTLF